MQRHGSLAMVSPCCSSSRQITHSPASLASTSSKVQTHTHTEQNMYQYAPRTPITPAAYQTQQREESSLVHHTDYSGSFLLVPVQMLCLHTNSYSLETICAQGKLKKYVNCSQGWALHYMHPASLHCWAQIWFMCTFTIKAPPSLVWVAQSWLTFMKTNDGLLNVHCCS